MLHARATVVLRVIVCLSVATLTRASHAEDRCESVFTKYAFGMGARSTYRTITMMPERRSGAPLPVIVQWEQVVSARTPGTLSLDEIPLISEGNPFPSKIEATCNTAGLIVPRSGVVDSRAPTEWTVTSASGVTLPRAVPAIGATFTANFVMDGVKKIEGLKTTIDMAVQVTKTFTGREAITLSSEGTPRSAARFTTTTTSTTVTTAEVKTAKRGIQTVTVSQTAVTTGSEWWDLGGDGLLKVEETWAFSGVSSTSTTELQSIVRPVCAAAGASCLSGSGCCGGNCCNGTCCAGACCNGQCCAGVCCSGQCCGKTCEPEEISGVDRCCAAVAQRCTNSGDCCNDLVCKTDTGTCDAPDAPEVTGLESMYTQYFLQGPTLPNNFTATVDWKDGQPGQVEFTLGSAAPVSVAANGNTALYARDLGTQVPLGGVDLTAVAVNGSGQRSLPRTIKVWVFPIPPWARPFAFRIGGSAQPGSVSYKGDTEVPAQPIANLNISVPPSIPLVGGLWGLRPFQIDLTATPSSLGTTTDLVVKSDAKFSLGDGDIRGVDTSGRGTMTLGATGLQVSPITAKLALPLLMIDKDFGLLALLGVGVPTGFLGYLIDKVDVLPKLRITLGLQFSVDMTIAPSGPSLEVTDLSGRAATGFTAALVIGPSFAWVSAGVGGKIIIDYGFVGKPGVRDCTFIFTVFVDAGAWWTQGSNRKEKPWPWTCKGNGAAPGPGGPSGPPAPPLDLTLRMPARPPGWAPERVVAEPGGVAGLDETALVTNASLAPMPALAAGPGDALALAWVAEAASKPRAKAAEIVVRTRGAKGWDAPVAVTDDERLDFAPAVAFDGQGQTVLVWTRLGAGALDAQGVLGEDFGRDSTLGWAVVAGGRVTASGTLGDDPAVPGGRVRARLVRGADGVVWAAWEVVPSGLIGTSAKPSRLFAARWDGRAWSAPEVVTSSLVGATRVSFAAFDRERALVVAEVGDRSADVTAFAREGGRFVEHRLTRDATPDGGPLCAYDPSGKPVVAWLAGSDVVGLVGDLTARPRVWLAKDHDVPPTLGDGALLVRGAGEYALVWPDQHGVRWSRHHPADDSWDAPSVLGPDDTRRNSIAPILTADGALVVALAEAPADRKTRGGGRVLLDRVASLFAPR